MEGARGERGKAGVKGTRQAGRNEYERLRKGRKGMSAEV